MCEIFIDDDQEQQYHDNKSDALNFFERDYQDNFA